MTTYALLPGAWSGGWQWRAVARYLQADGQKAFALTHPLTWTQRIPNLKEWQRMAMDAPTTPHYEIFTPPLAEWRAFKELRLRALQTEPVAFGTWYDEALSRPDTFWQAWLREAVDGTCWLLVARIADQLVGTAGAFRSAEDRLQHRATIRGVYVNAAARGQGVGRGLLTTLLARLAADPEIRVVRLTVNPNQPAAVRLYARLGFTEIGQQLAMLGDGQEHIELLLERVI